MQRHDIPRTVTTELLLQAKVPIRYIRLMSSQFRLSVCRLSCHWKYCSIQLLPFSRYLTAKNIVTLKFSSGVTYLRIYAPSVKSIGPGGAIIVAVLHIELRKRQGKVVRLRQFIGGMVKMATIQNGDKNLSQMIQLLLKPCY